MIISLKCLTHPSVECLYVSNDFGAASAQSGRGSIAGTVSCPAGYVISSASIKLTPGETSTAQEGREWQ